MSSGPPPGRKFYTGFPVLAIYNTATPPAIQSVIRWHEEDNQPEPADWWPEKVLACPDITTKDGKDTSYVLGWRIRGEIRYQVWPEGYCTVNRVTVGLQVTEYEMNEIRDAELRGWHLQYYPHAELFGGVYDATRDIIVEANEAHRTKAQDRATAVFRFRYRSLVSTAANLWTYCDHL